MFKIFDDLLRKYELKSKVKTSCRVTSLQRTTCECICK